MFVNYFPQKVVFHLKQHSKTSGLVTQFIPNTQIIPIGTQTYLMLP